MENNKVLDFENGETIFLSYFNDDERIVSGYCVFLEISNGLLKFKTNQNVLAIPTSRILKIKKNVEAEK